MRKSSRIWRESTGNPIQSKENIMMNMNRIFSSLLLLITTLTPVTVVTAGEGDQWEYDATIYLWGAGIDATTQTGGDIGISFSDILDDLDMGLMAGFGARKGKLSLLADVIYLDISQSDGGKESIPLLGGAIDVTKTVNTDVKLKSWITTFAAGYNVVDNEKVAMDLVGGARYLWLDAEVKLDLGVKGSGGRLNTSRKSKDSDSDHVWDGIVGVKGKINLSSNWYLPYYADIGTGGSKSTWQALAGVGYSFKWGDVLLAYRYLDYDFDSDFMLDDMKISGPALGARFRF
jgi:hypothetical protein